MSIKIPGEPIDAIVTTQVIKRPGVTKNARGTHFCCNCEQPIEDKDGNRIRHVKVVADFLYPAGEALARMLADEPMTKQFILHPHCWRAILNAKRPGALVGPGGALIWAGRPTICNAD